MLARSAAGLDLLGFPVSQAAFAAHIKYLQGQGYIDVWRNKDMPGYRIDRPNCGDPNEIRFARLSPKGLQPARRPDRGRSLCEVRLMACFLCNGTGRVCDICGDPEVACDCADATFSDCRSL